uniref:MFS domain-containing protein n=1 Tax=Trichobilharzia regenti TaxID=157069 RepID=A0AA85JMT2_TRIRE|nr:unnamed protein product [Trichobilharzia regenti]
MSTVYVDRGMAWCTVVGGFVANVLLGGLGKSYSLVMEAFQEVFESGSAYLFLAGGLIYTLMYCLSLVNYHLSKRYGSRPVVAVGAFGSCISLLIAACSPNLALWVVAVGFGVGASLSCIYFTVFAVVGCCFKRYLGLANGISVAGVSVGQMVFPTLITHLNVTYGARGGAVVMAAICLHLLVTAALMPRYIIDPDAPQPAENSNNNKTSKNNSSHKKAKSKEGKQLLSVMDSLNNSQDGKDDGVGVKDSTLNNPVDEFFSKLDDQRDVIHSGKNIDSSVDVLSTSTVSKGSSSVVSSKSRNAKRLTRALLIIYIVAKAFGDVGDVSVSFIAPLFGTELVLSSTTINRAIALSGVGDLITRLGVGWLTDRTICIGRRGLLLGVTWLVEGLNAFAFSQLHLLSGKYHANSPQNDDSVTIKMLYYLCFTIHGICSGTAMTQMVVVLTDWVGSGQLARSLAITMVILGLVISPGQFLMGVIADFSGSYVWSLYVCGVILLSAGFILLLEFPVRRLYPLRYLGLNTNTYRNNINNNNVNDNNKGSKLCITVEDDIEGGDLGNGLVINGHCGDPNVGKNSELLFPTAPPNDDTKWEIIDSDIENNVNNTTELLNTSKNRLNRS